VANVFTRRANFERFITRSGFAGGYYWSSLNKETVAEFSAADTGRADLIQNVIDGELTVERALKIARRRRLAVTLDHAAQSGRHAHSERGLDLYSTPPEAVEALLHATGKQMPALLCDSNFGADR
jgi:hypothetical protein